MLALSKTKKALLLFVIGFFLYLPSFGNKFVWDDEQFIYANAYVRNFDVGKIFTTSTTAGAGVASNYYRPLTTFSFAIDHVIWGLNPFGFHLTNTFLHALSGVFLYFLLIKIGLPDKKSSLLSPAWWIAVLFIIHPIQTEAVVYMNSRGDSLFTFFGFLSLLALVHTQRKNSEVTIAGIKMDLPWMVFPFLAAFFYLSSILAKEIGIMVVGIGSLLFVWEAWITKTKPIFSKIISLVGMWLVAIFYLILRSTVLNFTSFNLYGEQNIYTESILVRLFTFCKVLWTYWYLLLWPNPLHMERSSPIIVSAVDPWVLGTFVFLLGLLVLGIYEIKHKKRPWFSFGLLWFFGGLIPVSGILPINGILYEHWLYAPMIGFFIALYGFLSLLLERVKAKRFTTENQGKILAILFLISILLGAKTLYQNWLWRSPISLYTYLLKYTQSARIYNNLGMAYSQSKQEDLAIENYQKSIDLFAGYPQTHYNLGRSYAQRKEYDLAQAEFAKAIELSPSFALAHLVRIKYAQDQGKLDDSAVFIDEMKKIFSNLPDLQLLERRQKKLLES